MSSGPSLELKEFARRLLAYESGSAQRAEDKNSAVLCVCERLRESLGKFLGVGGFQALLSRALALADKQVPWLGGLQIKGDGALEGLEEVEAKFDSRELAEGEVVLVAQLLGLLLTFIGPALTLRLLQDIWPKMDD